MSGLGAVSLREKREFGRVLLQQLEENTQTTQAKTRQIRAATQLFQENNDGEAAAVRTRVENAERSNHTDVGGISFGMATVMGVCGGIGLALLYSRLTGKSANTVHRAFTRIYIPQ
jgi:hypothetical protein